MATLGDVQPLALVARTLAWVGATTIRDARWRREQRPDLADDLRPFQPASLGDEAQD
jgi:hypothetical protein